MLSEKIRNIIIITYLFINILKSFTQINTMSYSELLICAQPSTVLLTFPFVSGNEPLVNHISNSRNSEAGPKVSPLLFFGPTHR